MTSLFASILPGVREFRAPITAGLLWLVAAYIWFAERLTAASGSVGGRRLSELLEDFGRIPAGLVVGLLAYLLGSLSLSLSERIAFALTTRADYVVGKEETYDVVRRGAFLPRGDYVGRTPRGVLRALRHRLLVQYLPIRENGVSSIYRRLERVSEDNDPSDIPEIFLHMARHPSVRYDDLDGSDPPESYLRYQQVQKAFWFFERAVFKDVFRGDIASRLLTSPTLLVLYQEYDHHRAEAELRFATAVPGMALGFTLVATTGLSWVGITLGTLGVLSFFVAVYLQGASRRAQAGDVLAVAVGDGLISTPTLERTPGDRQSRVDSVTAAVDGNATRAPALATLPASEMFGD